MKVTIVVEAPASLLAGKVADVRARLRRELDSTELRLVSAKLPTKPTGSRAKGRNNEIALAKGFSSWLTYGEDEFVVAHRSSSGGAQRDREGLSSAAGDLIVQKDCPLARRFFDLFTVEAKHHRDLTGSLWQAMLGQPDGVIDAAWQQAREQAQPYGRWSLLVLRTDRREQLVLSNCIALTPDAFVDSQGGVALLALNDLFDVDPESLCGMLETLSRR